MLADPDSFTLPERGDRAYAALTSVAAAVAADPSGDRWERGWRAFARAAGSAPDVAAAAARTLARCRPRAPRFRTRSRSSRRCCATPACSETVGALDAEKVAAARLWATARMPYLASAIFASTVVTDSDSGTIAIDRSWQLHANPTVVDQLTVEQLGRLLIHLSGHTIRDHASRAHQLGVADDNQRARWNRCADAEINDDLLADDLVPDVAPDLPRHLRCEPGRLTEHYYEDARDGRRRWDCGSGADGCDRPGDGKGNIDPQQAQLLALSVAAEIQREHAREPGSVAGGWVRWAESVLPSRIDWRRVLAAEVRSAVAAVAGKVDYSYRRPSRRANLNREVVLPSLRRPIPDVAIVCDTSGSMHERPLARALAEIEAVLTRAGLRQAQVSVLAVDTSLHPGSG